MNLLVSSDDVETWHFNLGGIQKPGIIKIHRTANYATIKLPYENMAKRIQVADAESRIATYVAYQLNQNMYHPWINLRRVPNPELFVLESN